MKVAVIGTGAMGSVYAALMGASGNEVWAIDSWQEHIDAIKANGLHLEGASGDTTAKINASTNAEDAGPCDLVIIATKAAHVVDAATSALPLVGSDTTVLTIQNGLGSAQRVRDVMGDVNLSIGVVGGFGASMKGPGHAHHNGWELVRLGEFEGPATDRLKDVAGVWKAAGFRVRTFDDINKMIWEKLICNVCYSGSCSLTELTVGEVQQHPEVWKMASGCAVEAWNVAKARNIAVDIDDPVKYVYDFGQAIPKSRPSMLLDHLAGRPCEIDVINGAVPREAEGTGVETPLNTTVATLVRQREQRLGVS